MKVDKPIPNASVLLTGNVTGSPALRFGPLHGTKSRDHPRRPELRRANPAHPEAIDAFVLELMVQVRRNNRTPSGLFFVRREALAQHLEVPEHFVEQALQRLCHRGLLHTARNEPLHDTNRDAWGGASSGWAGSMWPMNLEKLDQYIAQLAVPTRVAAPADQPALRATARRMRP